MRYKKDCQNIVIKWVRFEQNFVEKSNEKLVGAPECQNNNFAQWLSFFLPLNPCFFFFYNSESFLRTKILFSIYIKNINRAALVGADVENPEPHLFSISNIFWKETQIGNHVFWQHGIFLQESDMMNIYLTAVGRIQ